MENPNKLIRLQTENSSLLERIREATSQPVTYLAPTIKSILEERDVVKKTKWRIFNPGRYYNGSVLLFLPEAHFRWQEPVTNGKEYGQLLEAATEMYSLKFAEVKRFGEETGDWDEALRRGLALTKEILLPAIEMGRLYDGITELPVIPNGYSTLSNDQKLYYIGINYTIFSERRRDLRKSVMEFYQDHSGFPTIGKATKPSLADVLRGMVPQLEPGV